MPVGAGPSRHPRFAKCRLRAPPSSASHLPRLYLLWLCLLWLYFLRLRATFVDIALLAGGVDFVHMGQASNYATWAEGWRGLGENGSFDFPTQFNERSGKAACAHWLADKGHGNARALDRGEARRSTDGVL